MWLAWSETGLGPRKWIPLMWMSLPVTSNIDAPSALSVVNSVGRLPRLPRSPISWMPDLTGRSLYGVMSQNESRGMTIRPL